MMEVWLFGVLVGTLASGLALFLVLLALGSVAYIGVTLASGMGRAEDGRARRIAFAVGGLLGTAVALAGVRVGEGGETFLMALGIGAATGAAVSFLWTVATRSSHALAQARRAQTKRLVAMDYEAREKELLLRAATLRGDDLDAEVRDANAAVARLVAAVERLHATATDVENKLAGLEASAVDGDLGQALTRTRDEIRAKAELGGKVLAAAQVAAYRVACNAPVRLLLRRRPAELSESPRDLATTPGHAERLAEAMRTFLSEARVAREQLAAVPVVEVPDARDPKATALRDVDALVEAYTAVIERVEVVRLQRVVDTQMTEVATAAGTLSDQAMSAGLDPSDLSALVGEVTRAELVLGAASRPERDVQTLTDALTRSAIALDRGDGDTVDDLLRAMRELG